MNKDINHISAVKTEYELLKYKPSYSKYSRHFKFNTKPKVLSNISPVSYDYKHADFGGYSSDPKDALGHFKYVLGELKKVSDKKIRSYLLDQLETDYEYYTFCWIEERPAIVLEQLTEVLFYYGRWEKVYEFVSNELKSDNNPDAVNAYSFDELFIKMGDQLLLEENKPRSALKLYHLASSDWTPKDYNGDPFVNSNTYDRPKPKTMFDDDQKKLWHDKYMSYGSLMLGAYGSDEDRNFSFSQIYKELNDLTPGYTNDDIILEKLDDFIDCVQETLAKAASEDDFFNAARAAELMTRTICQKFLTTELFRLSFETDDVTKQYIDGIKRCSAYIEDEHDKILFDESAPGENFFQFVRIAKCRDYILDELRVKDNTERFAYYCPLSTFRYMLPDKNNGVDANCGKLSIMNIAYMNDPNDGKMLEKVLFGSESQPEPWPRHETKVPYVFIKCFTEKIDYLPMWQMYGDSGEGCCLVVDRSDDFSLYRICYLKQDVRFDIRISDNNRTIDCKFIKSILSNIKRIIQKECKSRKGEKAQNRVVRIYEFKEKCLKILGGAVYLFKDYTYSYEQECRIMEQYSSVSDDFQHTKRDIPMLFVYSKNPIQLSEVILGPKMKNTVDSLPYLKEQIEKMCRKTGREMPRITFSGIEYR